MGATKNKVVSLDNDKSLRDNLELGPDNLELDNLEPSPSLSPTREYSFNTGRGAVLSNEKKLTQRVEESEETEKCVSNKIR